jgi:chorismate mutase
MELADWRVRIDALNAELVRLLSERATCAVAIGKLKKQKMLPVLDAEREKQVLEAVIAKNTGPLSDDSIRRIFECIMAEHRRLEESHS